MEWMNWLDGFTSRWNKPRSGKEGRMIESRDYSISLKESSIA